jgi:hypothetical protein
MSQPHLDVIEPFRLVSEFANLPNDLSQSETLPKLVSRIRAEQFFLACDGAPRSTLTS